MNRKPNTNSKSKPSSSILLLLLLPLQLMSCAHSLRQIQPQIGTYVSSPKGFSTSSYWIEGPNDLIFIDTQFLLSAAKESIIKAETTTGKKVALAIVLHPNPDKFNGVSIFKNHGVKVVTSDAVLTRIPAVHQQRLEWFYDRFKPDYPKALSLPESVVSEVELTQDGVKIQLHHFQKGCSDAHVVAQVGSALFTGDLVTNGFHSWLELGYLEEWIDVIKKLVRLNPTQVYPGRGRSGGPELLQVQLNYLLSVQDAIAAANKTPKAARDFGRWSQFVEKTMLEKYPDYFYPKFVENGLGALFERYGK